MSLQLFSKHRRRLGVVVAGAAAVIGVSGAFALSRSSTSDPSSQFQLPFQKARISKRELAAAIGKPASAAHFPAEIQLNAGSSEKRFVPQYTFDSTLQSKMEELFRTYDPDHGAFVAIDASTGRILSLISHTRDAQLAAQGSLALRATAPSASVFKVVTAAAAIAERKFSANSMIPFLGGNHTLYRKNVLASAESGRWVRHMTLRDAFARSVNTVFGRIGAFSLGAERLRNYAGRFGFNGEIASDLSIEPGRAPIVDDPWELAESASGFTKDNKMSPLQGALIAAAVVNEGKMMEPYVVQSLHTLNSAGNAGAESVVAYQATPTLFRQVIDQNTAGELRKLMRETVTHGTSKRPFRGFFRQQGFASVDVGGKTGSLTGEDPPGKYDWFVGYGEYQGRKIAISALTVNRAQWKVKSSYLARRAIETHFGERIRADHARKRRSTVALR